MDKVWSLIENVLHFIICKLLRIKISISSWEALMQFVKFGIVGLSNTIISYITYSILVILGIHYLLAQIVAFIVSVLNSFFWNDKYVFKEKSRTRNSWKTFVKTFISYAGTGLILSGLLLYFWIEVLHIHELIAPIINLLITIPLNFVLNKLWAFKE